MPKHDMQPMRFDCDKDEERIVVNRTGRLQHYKFDCGEYGEISFAVPAGGSFAYKRTEHLPQVFTD